MYYRPTLYLSCDNFFLEIACHRYFFVGTGNSWSIVCMWAQLNSPTVCFPTNTIIIYSVQVRDMQKPILLSIISYFCQTLVNHKLCHGYSLHGITCICTRKNYIFYLKIKPVSLLPLYLSCPIFKVVVVVVVQVHVLA